MSNEKACENCYYSRVAIREDLVFCSYLADTMGDTKDGRIVEHVIDTLRFKGFMFEGYVQMDPKDKEEPVKMPCVTLKSQCRKFSAKRT